MVEDCEGKRRSECARRGKSVDGERLTECEPDEESKAGELDKGRGEEDVLPAEEERDGPLQSRRASIQRVYGHASRTEGRLTIRMVLQVSIVDLAVAESTLVMLSPNALNDEIESMLLNGKDVISAALWPVRAIVEGSGGLT